ncbi:MAG TPA: hypothetical protein VFB90_07640 [Dehalococcoidia bacterium]|nr:hypothetical protein [Dehalococcoidia bacterium]
MSERDLIVDTLEQLMPQLNWVLTNLEEPQRYKAVGSSNTIASTAMHMLRDIDGNVNTVCRGQPDIWTAKGYAAKFGIDPEMKHFAIPHDDQLALRFEPWDQMLDYMHDVLDGAYDYVKNSSGQEMETIIPNARMDTYHSGDYSKARVIRGRLQHASIHFGEICVLRGAQGLTGAPEGRV